MQKFVLLPKQADAVQVTKKNFNEKKLPKWVVFDESNGKFLANHPKAPKNYEIQEGNWIVIFRQDPDDFHEASEDHFYKMFKPISQYHSVEVKISLPELNILWEGLECFTTGVKLSQSNMSSGLTYKIAILFARVRNCQETVKQRTMNLILQCANQEEVEVINKSIQETFNALSLETQTRLTQELLPQIQQGTFEVKLPVLTLFEAEIDTLIMSMKDLTIDNAEKIRKGFDFIYETTFLLTNSTTDTQ